MSDLWLVTVTRLNKWRFKTFFCIWIFNAWVVTFSLLSLKFRRSLIKSNWYVNIYFVTSIVTCLHWSVRLVSLISYRLVSISLILLSLCVKALVIYLIIAHTVLYEYFVISLQCRHRLIFRDIAGQLTNLATTLAVADVRNCKLVFNPFKWWPNRSWGCFRRVRYNSLLLCKLACRIWKYSCKRRL